MFPDFFKGLLNLALFNFYLWKEREFKHLKISVHLYYFGESLSQLLSSCRDVFLLLQSSQNLSLILLYLVSELPGKISQGHLWFLLTLKPLKISWQKYQHSYNLERYKFPPNFMDVAYAMPIGSFKCFWREIQILGT